MLKTWQRKLRIVLYVIIGFSIIGMALTYFIIDHQLYERRKHGEQIARQRIGKLALALDEKLYVVESEVDALRAELSSGQLSYEDLLAVLEKKTKKHTYMYGIGVAFVPNAYPGKRLYAPYYLRRDGRFQWIDISSEYDYTQLRAKDGSGPDTDWYHESLKEAGWQEQYYGQVARENLSDYGGSFTTPGTNKKAGVLFVSFPMRELQYFVQKYHLGVTGYAFLVTENKEVLFHPMFSEPNFLKKDYKNSIQFIKKYKDSKDSGIHVFRSGDSWYFLKRLPRSKEYLFVSVKHKEIQPVTSWAIELLEIMIKLLVVIFLLAIIGLVFRLERMRNATLWGICITFSLGVFTVAVSAMVKVYLSPPKAEKTLVLVNSHVLNQYLNNKVYRIKGKGKDVVKIPMGIFLETLNLKTPFQVDMSGYVWFRIPTKLVGELRVIPYFPREISRDGEVKLLYRKTSGDETIVVWHFFTQIFQKVGPYFYPFDSRAIKIEILPTNLSGKVVFIPDFSSARLVNGAFKTGLSKSVHVKGWDIRRTFFTYDLFDLGVSFGLPENKYLVKYPTLNFNIEMRRNIINSLVSYGTVLGISSFMIFLVLAIEQKRSNKRIISDLTYLAGLFFVIALSHHTLRTHLGFHDISFLEWSYITLYIMLIYTGCNSMLSVKAPNFFLVKYKKNIILRLMYWPIIACSVLFEAIVHIIRFYIY